VGKHSARAGQAELQEQSEWNIETVVTNLCDSSCAPLDFAHLLLRLDFDDCGFRQRLRQRSGFVNLNFRLSGDIRFLGHHICNRSNLDSFHRTL